MKSTNALQVTLSFSYLQGDLTSTWPSFVEPSQSKYIVHSSFLSSTAAFAFLQLKETCVPIAKRKHPLLDWNRRAAHCWTLQHLQARSAKKKSSKWKPRIGKKITASHLWILARPGKSISLRENSVRRWYDSAMLRCHELLTNDIYNIEHLPLCCPYMIQKLTFPLFSFPLNAVLLEGIGYN